MKKIISVLLLCLTVSLCGCSSEQTASQNKTNEDPYSRDAKIYNNYLVDGGIDTLTKDWSEFSNPEDLKIKTCLVDLNNDNCYELYISLTGSESSDGYLSTTALLAIKNESVKVISSAIYSGGTIENASLDLNYDTASKQYVLFSFESSGDGADHINTTRKIYGYDGNDMVTLKELTVSYTNLAAGYEEYNKEAQKIQKETDLYFLDGDNFYSYKIDGKYASKSDYTSALVCYILPEDEKYIPKEGTKSNPLNLETQETN